MIKDYKESSDTPFEEKLMPPEQLDRFRKEDGMYYQSEERKKYKEKTKKEASKCIKIIIRRLHKHREKAIFNLSFVEGKPYYEISEKLKMTDVQITKVVKIIKRKLPKILQTYELFENLKEKLKERLTPEQYQVFELHYNKWMSYDQIRKKLNLRVKTAIGYRIKNGEKRLRYEHRWARFKFEEKDWKEYLELKKIRREQRTCERKKIVAED